MKSGCGINGLVLALGLAWSCSPQPPETLLERAWADYWNGHIDHALGSVRQVRTKLEETSPLFWEAGLFEAELLLGMGEREAARSLLERFTSEAFFPSSLEARRKMLFAWALIDNADVTDDELAARLLEHAQRMADSDQALRADIDFHHLKLLNRQRRYEELESLGRETIQNCLKAGDHHRAVRAMTRLGLYRLNRSRYDEAVALLEPALNLATDQNRFKGYVLTNLGICYGRLGYYEKGLAALERAVSFHREREFSLGIQGSWGDMGNIYYFQRQYQTAINYYQRALNLALEIGHPHASKWAGNMASTQISLENWDAAETMNEQAMSLKLRAGDLNTIPYLRLNAAAIYAGRKEFDKAEAQYQAVLKFEASRSEDEKIPALRWGGYAGLGRLHAERKHWDQAITHFENAVRAIEATNAGLSNPSDQISYFSRLIGFYQDYVDVLCKRGEPWAALEIAERSRARILTKRHDPETSLPPASVSQLEKTARQTGHAFLSYWLAPPRSFLWVITPEGKKHYQLPGESGITRLVESYWDAIQNLKNPLEGNIYAGEELYGMLLAPARDLLQGHDRVILVLDGSLHGLNFETLPIPGEQWRYWFQDVTVAVAPSLGHGLNHLETQPRDLDSVLIVGNPREVDPDFPELGYAGDEIHALQRWFAERQPVVMEREQATPAAFRNVDPSKFAMISFVAHARANRQAPLDSAVILSPSHPSGAYKLYAREIQELSLDAELVVISSCSSAGAKAYSGEGLVGFAWAFLRAGTRHVVAGLWDVSDRSTFELMDHFYEALDSGRPPRQALRAAKLAMLASPTKNYRKPYYWAPFQVYIR